MLIIYSPLEKVIKSHLCKTLKIWVGVCRYLGRLVCRCCGGMWELGLGLGLGRTWAGSVWGWYCVVESGRYIGSAVRGKSNLGRMQGISWAFGRVLVFVVVCTWSGNVPGK